MIDYGTAAGPVRLLIADVDESAPILTDAQVAAFLALNGHTDPQAVAAVSVVRWAAADALTAIATSEALLSKVIRTGDGLTTDGAKLAAELRAQAAQLRAQGDTAAEVEALADDDAGFGVLEFAPWPAP